MERESERTNAHSTVYTRFKALSLSHHWSISRARILCVCFFCSLLLFDQLWFAVVVNSAAWFLQPHSRAPFCSCERVSRAYFFVPSLQPLYSYSVLQFGCCYCCCALVAFCQSFVIQHKLFSMWDAVVLESLRIFFILCSILFLRRL